MTQLTIIPVASGIGGGNPGAAEGPVCMKASSFLSALDQQIQWEPFLLPQITGVSGRDALLSIAELCARLSGQTQVATQNHERFLVLGGDHSVAIGTWSGVAAALVGEGDLGLIWIDAHMDAHTFETTPSGNIHGMPVAALLGRGEDCLTHIASVGPTLQPQNLCMIGIRSFESGEESLLKSLGVKIYFMDEVISRGFDGVMREAIAHVTRHTVAFGVSLDIDGLDPKEAPGVATRAPKGVSVEDWFALLQVLAHDPRCIAYEIAEFNPALDDAHKTERIIAESVRVLLKIKGTGNERQRSLH